MGGMNREEGSVGGIGEPLREMVSALVDGEASEFETRRVLDEAAGAELRDLLGRHYTVRSLLRHEGEFLCPPALTRSILAAIEQEPLPRAGAAPGLRWRGWLGGAAIAASVCVATVAGVRSLAERNDQSAAPQLAAMSGSLGSLGQPAKAPMPMGAVAMTVGLRPPIADDADGLAQDRLRMFMLENTANAALNTPEGMMTYARVVSWDEP